MSEPDTTSQANRALPDQTNSGAQTQDYRPAPTTEFATSGVCVPGYRIVELLGRGGMGVVYRAVQEKANRPVALKMILAGAHADQADRLRFRAEAETAARLSHPHIVQLYEVGETPDGFPFFSLELVTGGTLAERLKQGSLRPAEAAVFLEALARAMQYAHERGIVHRDLKPANILLEGARDQEAPARDPASGSRTAVSPPAAPASRAADTRGLTPKVSDFGLAKQLDTEDRMTRTGAIMGTPNYMAPEQAFGQSKDVGPAADIYALGAILYECLTGRPPFKGVTIADTLEQVRTREPVALRDLVKEIPADLETVCLHCLHKDPQRRYPSAEALADDLHRFCAGQAISVRPVSKFEHGWRWCRRNPWLAGMGALVATSLIAVAGVSLFAYFDAAARNVKIERKRQEAVTARQQAENAQKEAEKAQKVARRRLEQSLQALALFASDFRFFCEDALVPGSSKSKLYEVLIKQLERQATEDGGKPSEDSLLNRSYMYQTMAIVYLDTMQTSKARETVDKGLKVTEQWLHLKPGDAYALSFRASLLGLKADVQERLNPAAAKALYPEVLKLRRQLMGNEAVDQFTPGRSLMQLADTLDKLQQFEESLKLREQVCKLQIEKGVGPDKLFESMDFWCWTYWKAYPFSRDSRQRKLYLEKADELSKRTLKIRPGSRRTLQRWASISRELGDTEYGLAKLAEARRNSAAAKQHANAAQKYYQQLAAISRQLAVAPDLLFAQRDYGRSFYALGLLQQNLGNRAAARASFETSRHIREQLVRDFATDPNRTDLKIDLLFSLVALGEHARAVREADAIQAAPFFRLSAGAPATLYRLACIYSLSVAAVEEVSRPRSPTEEDKKLQAVYRAKALKALEQSFALGNRDFFTMRRDADLISIRGDPRFQKVLELERRQQKKK